MRINWNKKKITYLVYFYGILLGSTGMFIFSYRDIGFYASIYILSGNVALFLIDWLRRRKK